MDKFTTLLIMFSFVFCCIAVWRAGQPEWNKLIAIAAAFYTAAELFGGVYHAFYTH